MRDRGAGDRTAEGPVLVHTRRCRRRCRPAFTAGGLILQQGGSSYRLLGLCRSNVQRNCMQGILKALMYTGHTCWCSTSRRFLTAARRPAGGRRACWPRRCHGRRLGGGDGAGFQGRLQASQAAGGDGFRAILRRRIDIALLVLSVAQQARHARARNALHTRAGRCRVGRSVAGGAQLRVTLWACCVHPGMVRHRCAGHSSGSSAAGMGTCGVSGAGRWKC